MIVNMLFISDRKADGASDVGRFPLSLVFANLSFPYFCPAILKASSSYSKVALIFSPANGNYIPFIIADATSILLTFGCR